MGGINGSSRFDSGLLVKMVSGGRSSSIIVYEPIGVEVIGFQGVIRGVRMAAGRCMGECW